MWYIIARDEERFARDGRSVKYTLYRSLLSAKLNKFALDLTAYGLEQTIDGTFLVSYGFEELEGLMRQTQLPYLNMNFVHENPRVNGDLIDFNTIIFTGCRKKIIAKYDPFIK